MTSDIEPAAAVSAALTRQPCVAVVRATHINDPASLTDALRERGFGIVEITLTVNGALDAIAEAANVAGAIVGAGTVLTSDQAEAAVAAGAQFLVSPCVSEDVASIARRHSVPYIPGAFTPGEIHDALALDPFAVKIFPASLGGPRYLHTLFGPFPRLRAVPSGGIALHEVVDYLAAGAIAVSLGSSLVPTAAIEHGDFSTIPTIGPWHGAVQQRESST